jgi:hypothetical protein
LTEEEEEQKEKNREYSRRYYERHKDKKREYYLEHRDNRIKYQEEYNLYHDKQLGTTNFNKNTDLDEELKRLGLYKYRALWHASTKKELKRAKKRLGLNENKHDSQDNENEFP